MPDAGESRDGKANGFGGILRRRTGGACGARHHARPVARTGREVGAGTDRADRRRSRPDAAPPVDLFRTLRRSAAHRARPAQPLQAGRADRGLGAEPARMDHARVRRWAGGLGPGDRQSRFPSQRIRICAEAIALGRRVRRQFLPRQSDAGDGARCCRRVARNFARSSASTTGRPSSPPATTRASRFPPSNRPIQ